MNVERLTILAETLENFAARPRPEVGFNMGQGEAPAEFYDDRSGNGCRTVACVAGWTEILFSPERRYVGLDTATHLLDIRDLVDDSGHELFAPSRVSGFEGDWTVARPQTHTDGDAP